MVFEPPIGVRETALDRSDLTSCRAAQDLPSSAILGVPGFNRFDSDDRTLAHEGGVRGPRGHFPVEQTGGAPDEDGAHGSPRETADTRRATRGRAHPRRKRSSRLPSSPGTRLNTTGNANNPSASGTHTGRRPPDTAVHRRLWASLRASMSRLAQPRHHTWTEPRGSPRAAFAVAILPGLVPSPNRRGRLVRRIDGGQPGGGPGLTGAPKPLARQGSSQTGLLHAYSPSFWRTRR